MCPSRTTHPNQRATAPVAEPATPVEELQVPEAIAADIRHCETAEDYAACVRLQSATWGADYRDVVTPALLKVSRRVGGVVAGAFLETGEIVGFVFGLTGVRAGRLVHWSHMLAVDESYRDRGVGRRLKAFQWGALREMGVESAYWTFDPLVARNAHLNLNLLRATLEEYVPDMYADSGSDLHAFGTDRLVVSWGLQNGGVHRPVPMREEAAVRGAAPVVNTNGGGHPLRVPHAVDTARVRIAIPADVDGLAAPDLGALRHWRESTRSAFQAYLARGYRPTRFERGAERGWYVLENGLVAE